ncbi:aminodeoxychorismate synthase component I [Zavarzinia compransoris]|uniref:aminodeoxychorismate synthase n=1 Tax=Zavarzinia compransoris TaxID=1264899 RepID=A0A317DWG3_9PROT|nr:aminodeoxychorismate synthase component I [Zavarzinia compransoris]PWR18684.1 aminodeoxychorismate synthase component I [Zavarzinia compransoris]TDP48658.1 para-aminobenzoate synthetase component 1 [Zavarzinia compransoris]
MAIHPLGPLDSMHAACRLAGLPGFAFLDSAQRHPAQGRHSYLTGDPAGWFEVRDGIAHWRGEIMAGTDALSSLRRLLARGRGAGAGFAPFGGGAVGFIAYEAGRLFEKQPETGPRPVPDMVFGLYDWLIAVDHARGEAVLATGLLPDGPGGRADQVRDLLAGPAAFGPAPRLSWRAEVEAGVFRARVARVIAAILAGDLFQANIAQGFAADWPAGADPFALYAALRAANPGDFAAFLDFPGLAVASSSPERFVKVAGGQVEARPIKGTIARARGAAEDAAQARALAASVKDRAENVMIVDLLRNDLSRVCRPHSVAVPELCAIESYAGLHHMVSTVTGTLAPGRDALDLIAAAFPGGSITGAPKPEAMRLIAELEGRPRGLYCGSIGWLGFDGAADLNIAIRTLTVQNGTARFQTGGGITALSDPAREYEETLLKASRIFAASGGLSM